MPSWPEIARHALTWLYPDRCELCLRIGEPPLCPDCRAAMTPLADPVRKHFVGTPLDFTASVFPFEGPAGRAVKLLKYGRATALGAPLAEIMHESSDNLSLPEFDVVVPVPIHWTRLCKRGFNQSDLLCEAFDQRQVAKNLLSRIRNTRPQVGLSRQERLTNLVGAFEASPHVHGMRILLIDDVTTSGGTATACVQALKAQGAAGIGILTLCGE